MENRRTGKIARLPLQIRDQVNVMMRDGVPYQGIIAELEKLGHPGVEEQNLTNWKQGGHWSWLREQDRVDEIRIRTEASLRMVQAMDADGRGHLADANQLILASQLNEVLQDFDPTMLRELMADKPEQFFNLARTINSQSNERTKREKLELELQKYRDKCAKAQAELQKLRDPKSDLNDDERTAILNKVDQILGLT